MQDTKFQRTALLLGDEAMRRISEARVIVFGVGGVGSWCAEGLVRSGISHLTIVDSDTVAETNINRQLMATTETVGRVKVDVLKERLLTINPDAEIMALQKVYEPATAESFSLDSYDFIIDAIDSLSNKVHLIQTATRTRAVFFSSMGAALKMDPSRIQTAEFWKVHTCPLAAALRRRLKKEGMPGKKFTCVFSDEVLQNRGVNTEVYGREEADADSPDWNARKAQINGALMHITAGFGLVLSSLVIRELYRKE